MITDANDDDDGSSERYCPFELPYEEYGDMMFERRLAMEDSLSPVASRTSRADESRRGSTVADTDGEWKRIPRPRIFNRWLTSAHQSHDLLLSRLEVAIPIEAPAHLRGAHALLVYRSRSAQEVKARHQTRVVIQQMILEQTMTTMKMGTMALRATVRRRMQAMRKRKVAREALGHEPPGPRRRTRSHHLELQRAALADGAEVCDLANVQLSFDTYGVWERAFTSFLGVYDYLEQKPFVLFYLMSGNQIFIPT